jgi:Core binding factor beta subunit
MDELVEHLTTGDHPVVVGGPNATLEELRKRFEDMGYVFVKFTGTRGGTDLGFELDREASDASAANFDEGKGTLHVEGLLVLNYEPVRVIADIDLATLEGTGRLKIDQKAMELLAGESS